MHCHNLLYASLNVNNDFHFFLLLLSALLSRFATTRTNFLTFSVFGFLGLQRTALNLNDHSAFFLRMSSNDGRNERKFLLLNKRFGSQYFGWNNAFVYAFLANLLWVKELLRKPLKRVIWLKFRWLQRNGGG